MEDGVVNKNRCWHCHCGHVSMLMLGCSSEQRCASQSCACVYILGSNLAGLSELLMLPVSSPDRERREAVLQRTQRTHCMANIVTPIHGNKCEYWSLYRTASFCWHKRPRVSIKWSMYLAQGGCHLNILSVPNYERFSLTFSEVQALKCYTLNAFILYCNHTVLLFWFIPGHAECL